MRLGEIGVIIETVDEGIVVARAAELGGDSGLGSFYSDLSDPTLLPIETGRIVADAAVKGLNKIVKSGKTVENISPVVATGYLSLLGIA